MSSVTPEPSDAELLARAARGEESAFHALYLRHRDFVLRVARRYAPGDAAALDAAQEVFAHLLRKLPTLRLSGRLTTYLYPVARSCALDQRRRAARHDRLARRAAEQAPGMASGMAALRAATPAGDTTSALRTALDALPEAHREIVLLRIVEGLSVDEVAAAVGIPPGTVKSRLHHALAALRANPAIADLWGE